MEQIFKSFSELAASAIASRLRENPPGEPPGSEPTSRHGQVTEASVRFTLANGDEETTAHFADSYVPE